MDTYNYKVFLAAKDGPVFLITDNQRFSIWF